MYLEFYGLRKRPFDMTPDPAFFFPSQKHTEALSSLIYAVAEKRGFVVITGEIGSGKTTVCRTLLGKLDPAAKIAIITNTTLTVKQLLESICEQFELPAEKQTKVGLLSRLNRFLMEQNQAGNTVVLIVDEAQNLSIKALEEVRLISNIETDTQKLVQIMLLGQPELRDKLSMPELEQLRQRISLRYHLRSLDQEETRRYIEHRLSVAGDDGNVKFTKAAVDSLYKFSRGIPRLINVICDQALLLGYLRDTKKLDQRIVREIAAEFSYGETDRHIERQTGETRRGPFGFWKALKRKRATSGHRIEETPLPSPSGYAEGIGEDGEGVSPVQEEEILRRITGLKLAGIAADNGTFVARLDNIELRTGDRLFGMKVAQVDEDKIVFISGEKRYELAIEMDGNTENEDYSMTESGNGSNVEADELGL